MICQNCGKHQAVTQIKMNHNGIVSEYHLCTECAKKMGYGADSSLFNPFLNFNSLLGSFFGMEQKAEPETRCPTCGATFRDISQSGKVGCAECYKIFETRLLPSIQRIHGNTRHNGKIPTGMSLQVVPDATLTVSPQKAEPTKLETMEAQLKTAIAEQNFERAAELRDAIRAEKEKGGA